MKLLREPPALNQIKVMNLLLISLLLLEKLIISLQGARPFYFRPELHHRYDESEFRESRALHDHLLPNYKTMVERQVLIYGRSIRSESYNTTVPFMAPSSRQLGPS